MAVENKYTVKIILAAFSIMIVVLWRQDGIVGSIDTPIIRNNYFSMNAESIPGFSDPFSSMSHLLGALFFLFIGVKLIFVGIADTVEYSFLSFRSYFFYQWAESSIYLIAIQ